MKTIAWTRTLSEVLGVETERRTLTSKSGREYETDVVPKLSLIAIGSPTERKDENGNLTGYSYQVYDAKRDTGGFSITAPNRLDVKGMANVIFTGVRGGALTNKASGWFKADRVDAK